MGLIKIFIVLTVTAIVAVTAKSANQEQLYERGTDERIPTSKEQLQEVDNYKRRNDEEEIPQNKDDPDEQPHISERGEDEDIQVEEDQHFFERAYGIDVGIPLHEETEHVAIFKKFNEEALEKSNLTEFYRQLDEEISLYTRGSSTPVSYGMDMELLANSHPFKVLRPGESTDTDSCDKVTSVPSAMRKETFKPKGIPLFYTKYTEAYGIPIIGSKSVTDEGMMAACYLAKYMMAGRFDMRNCYYKLWGRIALIADNEQMTSLYEYTGFDKGYDTRTRGLGSTLHIPICSAGDDNSRCKIGDRYFDQSILLHEFTHGLHQMGAIYVIESFESRLKEAFESQVTKAGKWKNTYAGTNRNEYLATCSQFYHDAFRVPGKYLSDFGVKDQATLRKYDPKCAALLDDMFPCANKLIHRCDWKKCTTNDYELKYPESQKCEAKCSLVKYTSQAKDVEACANLGCYFEGNVINQRGSICKAVKCDGTGSASEMSMEQGKSSYNVYTCKKPIVLNMAEQKKQVLKTDCTMAPSFHNTGKRSLEKRGKKKKGGKKNKNKGKKIKKPTNTEGGSSSGTSSAACANAQNNRDCGDPRTANQATCEKRGCCWVSGKCKYGAQLCSNHYMQCPGLARNGYCDMDFGFMYKNCPLACGVCSQIQSVKQDVLDALCQNKNINCVAWADGGECSRNAKYMADTCPFSCKKCSTLPKNPLGK